MVKVCARDSQDNRVYVGECFKVASCCVRDGVPSWYGGLIAKVENIDIEDKKIEFEFYAMPLEQKSISVTAFKKHCTKHKPL